MSGFGMEYAGIVSDICIIININVEFVKGPQVSFKGLFSIKTNEQNNLMR
jgi:hypothetical protein